MPTGAEIEVPYGFRHVWDWFWELNDRRTSGDGAANPLTWVELHAWAAMTGATVRPMESRLIMSMDNAYLSECAVEYDDARERAQRTAPTPKGKG